MFQSKYLKYKQKYLDLKKKNKYMKGGTNATVDYVLYDSKTQYLDLKFNINQIISSLAKMDTKIYNDIETVGAKILGANSKGIMNLDSKLVSIENTLLDESAKNDLNKEELMLKVEEVGTTINDNVEELHQKFDNLNKALVQMELNLVKEMDKLKIKG